MESLIDYHPPPPPPPPELDPGAVEDEEIALLKELLSEVTRTPAVREVNAEPEYQEGL